MRDHYSSNANFLLAAYRLVTEELKRHVQLVIRHLPPTLQLLILLCKNSGLPRFEALPVHLLELIFSSCNIDKGMLRQTCKYFRKVVDGCLVRSRLSCYNRKQRKRVERFLKREQQVYSLQTLSIRSTLTVNSLLVHMPDYLTTLTIIWPKINVATLRGMIHLRDLNLQASYGSVLGISNLTGLTSLRCNQPVGSVAHLAPKLKQLCVIDCKHVEGLNHLTNLSVLAVWRILPPDFFQINSQVLLQHLCIYSFNEIFYGTAMKSAPTTLTRLTLHGPCVMRPNAWPPSLTFLRLLTATNKTVEDVALYFCHG